MSEREEDTTYQLYEKTDLGLNLLKAKPGDVLTVTFPDDMDPRQMHAALLQMHEATNEIGVHIVGLTQGITMQHVPQKEMNRLGWYKLHDGQVPTDGE